MSKHQTVSPVQHCKIYLTYAVSTAASFLKLLPSSCALTASMPLTFRPFACSPHQVSHAAVLVVHAAEQHVHQTSAVVLMTQ